MAKYDEDGDQRSDDEVRDQHEQRGLPETYLVVQEPGDGRTYEGSQRESTCPQSGHQPKRFHVVWKPESSGKFWNENRSEFF